MNAFTAFSDGSMSYITRLHAAVVKKQSPLCVGLDPRFESLPLAVQSRYPSTNSGQALAYEEFCSRVIDLVAPYCAAVKPQSAFFEALGSAGYQALEQVIAKAKSAGLLVILDAKRGDIASTASAYAEAAFVHLKADALTINPYLGQDAVEPFITEARRHGAGLYVLVRTSNAGAGVFQDVVTNDGMVHEVVARAVNQWTSEKLHDGWGDVGAVVGATSPAELLKLRQMMPQVPLLVPGYGAQGGTAKDCRAAFAVGGLGAVVNSSRGILFPYRPDDVTWEKKIEEAAIKAQRELAAVAGL
jgi:orotidine-5'-phosphate decarboxylase